MADGRDAVDVIAAGGERRAGPINERERHLLSAVVRKVPAASVRAKLLARSECEKCRTRIGRPVTPRAAVEPPAASARTGSSQTTYAGRAPGILPLQLIAEAAPCDCFALQQRKSFVRTKRSAGAGLFTPTRERPALGWAAAGRSYFSGFRTQVSSGSRERSVFCDRDVGGWKR